MDRVAREDLDALLERARRTDATGVRAQRRVDLLSALVECATVRGAGSLHTVPVRCPRRPERQRCGAWLELLRMDVPAEIHWRCPGCDDAGQIIGWRGGDWDLSRLRVRASRLRPRGFDSVEAAEGERGVAGKAEDGAGLSSAGEVHAGEVRPEWSLAARGHLPCTAWVTPDEFDELVTRPFELELKRFVLEGRPKADRVQLLGSADDFAELQARLAFAIGEEQRQAPAKRLRRVWSALARARAY